MLPTLDTEDEETEELCHGLAFLVNYGEEGIFVDSALDVSYAINKTWEGVLAAEKLTGIENAEAHTIAAGMSGLSLRARFVNTGSPGPYLVKTSFPLSRDDLEKYLRSLDKTALESFLQRSKI
jgi:hypothetical protein